MLIYSISPPLTLSPALTQKNYLVHNSKVTKLGWEYLNKWKGEGSKNRSKK